jgi:two-component system, chemotaxis family, chemotaxis protein CheY
VTRTVLLIEDDADVAEAIGDVLRDEGYPVALASNGREALELLQQSDLPFAILLDLRMPVMDGFEFRERQRRDPRLADIPVIVVSADRMVADNANRLGANVYLVKPLRPEVLLDAVALFQRPST